MIDFKDYNLIVDLKGIINTSINPGETKSIDWIVDNRYYLTGVDYETLEKNFGDTVTFQVVHPSGLVLAQFGTNVFVRQYQQYSFYKAVLQNGLIVRVIYKNVGVNTVFLNVNLICHRDK